MIITFYGEGCFKVQSGERVILSDPFDNKTGLTPPRFKTDIILKTLTPFPLTSQPTDSSTEQLIVGAGEYNINEVDIKGIALPKESTDKFIKTIYLVKTENINLCFLGHLSEMPEAGLLENLIEDVDILFVPGGGKPFIDQKAAVKLIKQIQPKVVIPSFFKVPGLKRPTADAKEFLSEFDHEKVTPEEKFTVKKKDLTEIKKTEVMLLKI